MNLVHGIVSTNPPRVRCDGCQLEATGPSLALVVLTCGIVFNPRLYSCGDNRRLCPGCQSGANWAR